MILKVVKLDVAGIEFQLSRVADCLEGLINTTNAPVYDIIATDETTGVFYSDDVQDIIREKLARMGKSLKD